MLASLKPEVTFGGNLTLKIPGWKFMPNYYCAGTESAGMREVDALIKEFGGDTERWCSFPTPPEVPGFNWVKKRSWLRMAGVFFTGLDHLNYTVDGHCSLFNTALPLACWAGCLKVYLLGCNATPVGYANDVERDRGGPKGVFLEDMITAATVAKTQMGIAGVELIDLTQGGNLTIPKDTLANVLEK
jgi:hypothetical protein